jgi:RNA polymerase sigma-70 factor (ECF subfamily)
MEPIAVCRTLLGVGTHDDLDWSLVRGGDGEAFGRVYDRHLQRVKRHCRRIADRPEDADDLVAITFLEAWRRRGSVRFVDGSLLPWLLVTATNAGRNLQRSARRHRALLERLAREPLADTDFDLDDAEQTRLALAGLSGKHREVLALCVLEGYSEREAADALGVPTGTIKSRLSRAKGELRTTLAAHGDVKEETA